MSEESQKCTDDPRTDCKYGAKCYQKNPEHLKKYKHPPTVTMKRKKNTHNHKVNKRNKESVVIKIGTSSQSNEKTEEERRERKKNEDEISQCTTTDIEIPKDTEFHDKNNHSCMNELFLVDMPADFFKFFQCLSDLDGSVEHTLSTVSLELIGPYDLLLGKLPILGNKELYLVHWRYFYDVPEFQAVLKRKGKSEYHIGYYRDTPEEAPVFLASNDSSVDCKLKPMAYNIFGAVYIYLQNETKKSPFTAMACNKLMNKVKKWAEEHDYTIAEFEMSKRNSRIVARTLHGAGIVVPYNKKTQLGYRPLVVKDSKLIQMFKDLSLTSDQTKKDKLLSELQPVITYANIAVDECDFGTGLEAGIDLFCSGVKELEPSALSTLTSVYGLLKRDAFSKIIQAHLKYRRKGSDMSLMQKK